MRSLSASTISIRRTLERASKGEPPFEASRSCRCRLQDIVADFARVKKFNSGLLKEVRLWLHEDNHLKYHVLDWKTSQ